MSFRIGEGSCYDTDIELIESFIKCKNETDNKNAKVFIFEYYVSSLKSYWNKCKENIKELHEKEPSDINKNLYKYSRYKNKEKESLDIFIDLINEAYSNLNSYENKFFNLLNIMIERFYEEYKINESEMFNLIMFIVNINCLKLEFSYDLSYFFKQYNSVRETFSVFFIFNDTGFFYINSYLYSLFNGVVIFGIPSSYESSWDGNIGNSYDFIIHDSGHFANIIMSTEISNNDLMLCIREKYYKVINSNLSRIEKECVSISLFIQLHEYFTSINNLIDYKRFKKTIIDDLEEGHDIALDGYFYDLTSVIYDELYPKNKEVMDFIKECPEGYKDVKDNHMTEATIFVHCMCNEILNK